MRHGHKILTVALLFSIASYSQRFEAKEATLQKVFGNIVTAYGNAKSAPSLELISKTRSQGYPASYISTPVPTIKVEEQVFDICMKMGPDSLNALSIILSHELAHYYNDHTWCTDYSYAIRHTSLGKEIQKISRGDQLTYETQADNNGFYYSCIAGYSPFRIYDRLIDKIYSDYKLPAIVKGYPGKEERKMIGRRAKEKISQLYPVYNAGLLLLYLNELPAAESCFDFLARYFPSREIYNNLGVAKFLKGLALKPYDSLNFVYPIDIDPVSRITQNSTRGDEKDIYIAILKDAKRQFERAQSLDPLYIKSYINLACVNDALGNYQMAMGNIYEAAQLSNPPVSIKHIEAIVQYHSRNIAMAEKLLQALAQQDSLAAFNYLLFVMVKNKRDIITLENFKDNYTRAIMLKGSSGKCQPGKEFSLKGKKSSVKINDRLTITSGTESSSQILISLPGREIQAQVTSGEKTGDAAGNHIEFIDPGQGCIVFAGPFSKTIRYKTK